MKSEGLGRFVIGIVVGVVLALGYLVYYRVDQYYNATYTVKVSGEVYRNCTGVLYGNGTIEFVTSDGRRVIAYNDWSAVREFSR